MVHFRYQTRTLCIQGDVPQRRLLRTVRANLRSCFVQLTQRENSSSDAEGAGPGHFRLALHDMRTDCVSLYRKDSAMCGIRVM